MGQLIEQLGPSVYLDTNIEHCDSFLTNDDGFKSVAGVRVVMLSDLLPTE
jgi:hypothetical protein